VNESRYVLGLVKGWIAGVFVSSWGEMWQVVVYCNVLLPAVSRQCCNEWLRLMLLLLYMMCWFIEKRERERLCCNHAGGSCLMVYCVEIVVLLYPQECQCVML
jgi:hypothetical protein